MRLALLAVAAFLVPGCASPGWDPIDCAEGPGPSGNAPPAALFDGSAEAVARRLADALGEPIRGPAESSAPAWSTEHGTLLVQEGPRVSFFGTGEAWLDRAGVERALDRLGIRGELVEERTGDHTMRWGQRWQGHSVAYVHFSAVPDGVSQDGGLGTFTSLEVGDLRDLSGAKASLGREGALAAADAFVACRGEWPGAAMQHEGGFDVVLDSVAYVFTYAYPTPASHCATSYVQVMVDAESGSVLAAEPVPCH